MYNRAPTLTAYLTSETTSERTQKMNAYSCHFVFRLYLIESGDILNLIETLADYLESLADYLESLADYLESLAD